MQISAAQRGTYRRLTRYTKNKLPQVIDVPVIVSAMNRIGQLNRAKLWTALRWGHGPTVRVTALHGAYGEFTPDIGSNEIRIDSGLVLKYEARQETRIRTPRGRRVELVGVTLLHELVHWGDDQNGVDRAGEEGAEFERAVYGGVIG